MITERLAAKWMDAQGDDIEPRFDRNCTDSRKVAIWWMAEIADELERAAEREREHSWAHQAKRHVLKWIRGEREPFAKGTFVTEQIVDTVARFQAKEFREALETIGHMFDHEEWYGENALSMRDVALDALKAVSE